MDHRTSDVERADGEPTRSAEQRHGDTVGFRRGRREGEIVPDGVYVRSVERRDGGELDRVGLFVLLNPARSTDVQELYSAVA